MNDQKNRKFSGRSKRSIIYRNHKSSSNHRNYKTPQANFKNLSKSLKLVFYAKHFPTNKQLKFGILCIEY